MVLLRSGSADSTDARREQRLAYLCTCHVCPQRLGGVATDTFARISSCRIPSSSSRGVILHEDGGAAQVELLEALVRRQQPALEWARTEGGQRQRPLLI